MSQLTLSDMKGVVDLDDLALPRYVIGLDPATACGWAVLRAATGERVASGTWDCSLRKGEGPDMRYVRLRALLEELLVAYSDPPNAGPSVIAYELVERHVRVVPGKPPVPNTYAAQTYGGILATILCLLGEMGLHRYVGIPVGTVKKAATGKGRASKEVMQKMARGRFNLGVVEEDEADALFVAVAALELLPASWRRST